LSDDITNSFNIKIFASLAREAKAFGAVNHANSKARKTYYYKMIWVWGFAWGFTGLAMEIGAMYMAITLRGEGVLAVGVIVLLQTYILRIMDFLGNMGNVFRQFFRCITEIGEVVAIIDTPHSVVDNTDKKLKVFEGTITFDAVDFSYDGVNKVFDNLSLHIKPGERIGLV
jgi:ABC-type multidrug transport system fused ATPase/permease subunit